MPGLFGSVAGDWRYRAPEVYTGSYNEYADMYMLGRTMKEVYDMPSTWQNLANCLLAVEPAQRITAQEVRETAEKNLHFLREDSASDSE
jgi:hypothetical protein